MPRTDALDVQLLKVFRALMEEGGVTRAAVRLGLSQPAVSLALARLRDIFSDRLFVRGREGMIPTEEALRLLPRVETLLADFQALAELPERFDPAASERAFVLAAPDYLAPTFFSSVVGKLRREAPGVRLTIMALGPDFDFEEALARGEVDVVVGNWPAPPPSLRRSVLLEDDVVCLMADSHPLAHGDFGEADYLGASHVVPVAYSPAHRGVVEAHLARLRAGRARTVAFSHFGSIPYALAGTDLIFTTSRHFAAFYAGFLPLSIREPPIGFPRMTFQLLWHDRTQGSPIHRWLRRVMLEAGRGLSR